MEQLRPEFWTNMVMQMPGMDATSAHPTAAHSGTPEGLTQMVTPAPRCQQLDSLLDGEKTGATLLFSGVFLALVGVIFTTMGWQHYLTNPTFEWTQLLGPILISVGGTFILTSICRFGIISCWPCRKWDEEVLVVPVTEQTSSGCSFTLSGMTRPPMLQGTTTMLCIPPVYTFKNQELHPATDFQAGGPINGVHAVSPSYDSVCCVDNGVFTAEEGDSSAHSAGTDRRRGRTERTEDEEGCHDDSGSTCSSPPAYEDIYPSFGRHDLT